MGNIKEIGLGPRGGYLLRKSKKKQKNKIICGLKHVNSINDLVSWELYGSEDMAPGFPSIMGCPPLILRASLSMKVKAGGAGHPPVSWAAAFFLLASKWMLLDWYIIWHIEIASEEYTGQAPYRLWHTILRKFLLFWILFLLHSSRRPF